MDNKEIQELIKLINKSNIGELTVERKDFKLTIRQKEDKGVAQVVTVAPQAVAMPQSVAHAPAAAPAPSVEAPAASKPQAAPKEENLLIIRSPMIGTFYRRPSPDKPLFVEVGDDVSVGKVVCIIEAMKLLNEIDHALAKFERGVYGVCEGTGEAIGL